MRQDDQQIDVAVLVRSPVGIGTKEQHLARMQAPDEALDKHINARRVSGWHENRYGNLTCCGSQSVVRPGTLYS